MSVCLYISKEVSIPLLPLLTSNFTIRYVMAVMEIFSGMNVSGICENVTTMGIQVMNSLTAKILQNRCKGSSVTRHNQPLELPGGLSRKYASDSKKDEDLKSFYDLFLIVQYVCLKWPETFFQKGLRLTIY